MIKDFEKAKEQISAANSIGIISHINPDGDNIGSLIGLGEGLKKIGKKVRLLKSDEVPKYLAFLPKTEEIRELEKNEKFDLLIVLDSGDFKRTGDVGERALKVSNGVLNIDHHISNTYFGDVNIVFPNYCATAEILYDFLKYMEIEIDKDMATALYTGLVTDSGNFIYENVTSDTLRKAANLVDFGADRRYIYRMLYQMNKLEALLLQNEILSNTKLYYNNKLAISYVNYKLFEKYNCKKEDLEGLVNIYRDLECVEVSIFLVEEKFEEIKASMRSKEYVDLSVIGKALGGGGHVHAAGALLKGNVEDVTKEILKRFDEVKWR